jgi:hypothetical protein
VNRVLDGLNVNPAVCSSSRCELHDFETVALKPRAHVSLKREPAIKLIAVLPAWQCVEQRAPNVNGTRPRLRSVRLADGDERT